MLKDALGMRGAIADTCSADDRIAPHILVANFGDGDAELLARPLQEAAQDAAFVFERAATLKAQLQFECSDYHSGYLTKSEP